jgi:ribosomal protein S18 acetylase RimI-like enzyme
MTISIRRARVDDAEFLARIMLSASRGHLTQGGWDLLIGADEAGCLDYLRRLAVAEPRSLCHYESFLVAEVDGQPGGALSSFKINAGGWATVGEAMAKVQRELGWTETDTAGSQKRVAPVWACFLPDVGADWGIENVASRLECRRRGLVKVLVEQSLREGRERGCKLAQISTYIGNDAAVSVYEKSGFKFSDERRCSAMSSVLDAPGFVRLIRRL